MKLYFYLVFRFGTFLIWIFLIAIFILACDLKGPHQTLMTGNTSNILGEGVVSYEQVQPIFKSRCQSCHTSPASDPSRPDWQNKGVAISKRLKIKEKILSKQMPLPSSPEASAITEVERQLIVKWAEGSSMDSVQEVATTPSSIAGVGGFVNEESRLARFNALVQRCVGCHGAFGLSDEKTPYPQLAGQSKQYLKRQLLAFKSGRRKSDVMSGMVRDLSESEINVLVEYFYKDNSFMTFLEKFVLNNQNQPDQEVQLIKNINQTQTRKLILVCNSCHDIRGSNGSEGPLFPRLKNQKVSYLKDRLYFFRDLGDNTILAVTPPMPANFEDASKEAQTYQLNQNMMTAVIANLNLTDDQINWLAEYFHNPSLLQLYDE
ncbi:MAG: hypothetical protein K1X29_04815 [Bdellovibrionales bacterium]|nr:hypothetical protein [Bdellovibrionales bacterium]